MNYNDFNTVYDKLIDNEFFTEEEIRLVCYINGWNIDTLNSAIYVRYGYHDLEQLLECE